MANYRNAIRENILAKIAVYLAANGSRDVAGRFRTLPRFETRLFTTHGASATKYAIVPKLKMQNLHEPGINIVFLDEDSQAPRLSQKRWLLGVVVRIVRPLAAGEDAFATFAEVSDLMEKILDCLSDHFINIYDFRTPGTDLLGVASVDKDADFKPEDESAPIEGGDIRLALTFYVTYVDKSR